MNAGFGQSFGDADLIVFGEDDASLLFAVALLGWQPIGHVAYHASAWPAPFLYALQAIGLLLIVGAARTIDALELAGIRSTTSERLAIRGPAVVR